MPFSGRNSTTAESFIAIAIGLAVAWLAKLVLVTLLVSAIFAFLLEPLVALMARIRLSRPVGAFIAVVLTLSMLCGLVYFCSARIAAFAQDLPRYAQHVRQSLAPLQAQRERLEKTTDAVLPFTDGDPHKAPLTVQQEGDDREAFLKSLGSASELLLAISFVPFLVYFMLSWQEHLRDTTVGLFPPAKQAHAGAALGEIAVMIRAFMAGNFIIGLILSVVSTVLFAFLGVPNFYFIGPISGFLSVVPYLGVLFAMLPPLVATVEQMTVGRAFAIVGTVLALHLVALNVLFPKLIGKRLSINPLAITIALLFWGWFWGALGLLLAVPITGALKAICDHVDGLRPWGRLLGE